MSKSGRYRTDTTFVGRTPDGSPLHSPLQEGIVAYPQVFMDAEDTPHLFWVEPNPDSLEARLQEERPRGTPLFYTVLHSERRNDGPTASWTSPDTVFHGGGKNYVYWTDQAPPGFGLTSDGRLLITFHSVGSEANELFVQTESGWENRSLSLAGPTVSTDLAISERNRIYFAGITGHPEAGPNSVLVRWSDDDGQSWSDSTLIYPSHGKKASYPNVLVDTTGTVHLLWAQSTDPGNTEEAISYTYSEDRGRTWSEIQRVSVENVHSVHTMFTLKAELTPCGTPVAVFSAAHTPEGSQQKDLSLFTTRFTRSGGDPPSLLLDEGYAYSFSIKRDETGAVHLVWSKRNRPEYGAPAVPLHSVLDE